MRSTLHSGTPSCSDICPEASCASASDDRVASDNRHIGTLLPDLRCLLAVPAERHDVLARQDLRHQDLVQNVELEELRCSLVLGAIVAAQLAELVAVCRIVPFGLIAAPM